MRKLLATETAIHTHASQQLDETLAEFRRAFDVDALVKTFEHALDGMMARGTWRNNSATGMGTGTTLLVDDCARSCAAQALDAKVRLRYETTDQVKDASETPAGWNFLKQYFPGDEARHPRAAAIGDRLPGTPSRRRRYQDAIAATRKFIETNVTHTTSYS